MWKIFDGFKNFILRGNAVDLAVGVVIGAAFGAVVNSLVKDLLTPLIGAIAKVPNFSGMFFILNGSKFMYGDLMNNAISFFLIAISIYFFVIMPMNILNAKVHKGKQTPITKKCPECKSDIPVDAKRCAFCTQIIK